MRNVAGFSNEFTGNKFQTSTKSRDPGNLPDIIPRRDYLLKSAFYKMSI